MCGRFLFSKEQTKEINDIIEEAQQNVKHKENGQIKFGEIFPTNSIPVLVQQDDRLVAQVTVWGFPKWDGKGVIINARAEGVTDKKMFRDSVLQRRCVIPTSGFYEWDRTKQKYLFRRPGSSILYLAGFYQTFNGSDRFVILTTDANISMKEIHHRMPVVLEPPEVSQWITDWEQAQTMLSRVPFDLVKSAG